MGVAISSKIYCGHLLLKSTNWTHLCLCSLPIFVCTELNADSFLQQYSVFCSLYLYNGEYTRNAGDSIVLIVFLAFHFYKIWPNFCTLVPASLVSMAFFCISTFSLLPLSVIHVTYSLFMPSYSPLHFF